MKMSIRLVRINGIDVGVNWSVLVLLVLFAWDFVAYGTGSASHQATVLDWVVGGVAAVVLLLSLLGHELAHALVARRNGVVVHSVTLFMFGGMTQLEGEAHTPGSDFRIAGVGPLTSFVLGATFFGCFVLGVASGAPTLLTDSLAWLAVLNGMLGVFNLIPTAPLDGGRILRSLLWKRWNDKERASVTASRAGRAFAALLVALGLVEVFLGGISGVWPVFIGMFLYSAARAEEGFAVLQQNLRNLAVADVMTSRPLTVPASTPVASLIAHELREYSGDCIVSAGSTGQAEAISSVRTLGSVPQGERGTVTLGMVATPIALLGRAHASDPADSIPVKLAAHGGSPVAVFDDDEMLVGVVTPNGIERTIALGGNPLHVLGFRSEK
ncbi:MAG: site-2 protease family protein [Candidatus Dormibacteria bacterium]